MFYSLLGAAFALTVAAPAARAQSWSYVPSPNRSAERNILNAVAAVSSSDVWAVGNYDSDPSTLYTMEQTLIEHWDGSAWSVVPSPNKGGYWNNLEAIAAVSADDIWAVGYWSDPPGQSQALIVHWNGSFWQTVAAPKTPFGSELRSVTVISKNDIWAGGLRGNEAPGPTQASFLIHWNGSSWTDAMRGTDLAPCPRTMFTRSEHTAIFTETTARWRPTGMARSGA
jgi:hypothetical protein